MNARKLDKKPVKRVLMALSGGIDSAVSLHLLLKAGYEVEAAFMKNWSSTVGLKYSECPWLDDRREALRVAAFFGVPLHTLDFEEQYQKRVMDYFFKEYKAGRTPNPDVMCNKEIKFRLLYEWAIKHGFEYLATGHYAQIQEYRIANSEYRKATQKELVNKSSFILERSVDEFKDQTYFIYNIKNEQLPHVLFPIGHMQKKQVRALARRLKLPNAERQESMGLCFVGKVRLKDFLEQKLKRKIGTIVDQDGKIIGEHEGLHYYTLGQRQGIKVGGGGPYFVTKKDLVSNTLFVTNDPEDKALFVKEVTIQSVNWIHMPQSFPVKLTARFRHQGDLLPVSVLDQGRDMFLVTFSKAQKAVASGQSLVLYKGAECLGGGVIA